MKHDYLLTGILLLLFFLIGCATAKFTQTGTLYPPYNGVVKVYSAAPSELKYEEIGWISSSGGMMHEWTHLIEALQREAASKGANGIIIVADDKTNIGFATYNPHNGLVAGQGAQKSMTAIAIRILE